MASNHQQQQQEPLVEPAPMEGIQAIESENLVSSSSDDGKNDDRASAPANAKGDGDDDGKNDRASADAKSSVSVHGTMANATGAASVQSFYRDCSQIPAAEPKGVSTSVLAQIASKEHTFPVKLHMILTDSRWAGIIAWLPHGRSWRILQQKRFETEVIPLYFRHGRYSSFARQVNGWGFRRITHGSDYNSYYHELFLRGLPHLCDRMRRLTAKDIAKRKKEGEIPAPDLYGLSRDHALPETAAAIAPSAAIPLSGAHMATAAGSVSQKSLADVELAILEKKRTEIMERINFLLASKQQSAQQAQPFNNQAQMTFQQHGAQGAPISFPPNVGELLRQQQQVLAVVPQQPQQVQAAVPQPDYASLFAQLASGNAVVPVLAPPVTVPMFGQQGNINAILQQAGIAAILQQGGQAQSSANAGNILAQLLQSVGAATGAQNTNTVAQVQPASAPAPNADALTQAFVAMSGNQLQAPAAPIPHVQTASEPAVPSASSVPAAPAPPSVALPQSVPNVPQQQAAVGTIDLAQLLSNGSNGPNANLQRQLLQAHFGNTAAIAAATNANGTQQPSNNGQQS